MVKIRLRRFGKRNTPIYRVVVADNRSPRDGRVIEEIGTYDPLLKKNNFTLKLDRVDYWLGVGAQPSDTVASFIKKARKGSLEEAVEEAAVEATEAPTAPAPAPEQEVAAVEDLRRAGRTALGDHPHPRAWTLGHLLLCFVPLGEESLRLLVHIPEKVIEQRFLLLVVSLFRLYCQKDANRFRSH